MLLERAPGSIFGGRLPARSSLESIAGRGIAAALPASPPPPPPPPPSPSLEARATSARQESPPLEAPAAASAPRRAESDPAADPAPASVGAARAALLAVAVDERLIEILDAPLAAGELASSGYLRKEEAIGAVFAALTVLESRALLARLEAARTGDRLVAKFTRLTAERRHRLLAFLADARRREALKLARTRR